MQLYFDFFADVCGRYRVHFPIASLAEFREWYHPRWERNFASLGLDEVQVQEVIADSEARLNYDSTMLFEGTAHRVLSLSRDFPMGIVSTAPPRHIEAQLERAGLRHCFEVVVGSEDGTSDKYHRVARALAALGSKRGVMVGDTEVDIEAGKAHNLKTIAVSYGWWSRDRLSATNPDRIVDNPEDLEAAVRDVLAGEVSV